MTVAYLVNQYPHVSHTFIRREIAALEAAGIVVRRFSVRPAPDHLADPADVAERARTHVILADGALRIVGSALACLATAPVAWLRALMTAIRFGRRSDRGVLRHLVYFAEACRLRRLACGVRHVHAHFGTNPATVALLCRLLGGPAYSFTVHGPEEFDHPRELNLGDKIRHSRFTVAISSFGRSQLFRWSRLDDWPRIHVVRCGVDAAYLGRDATPVPDCQTVVCVGRLCEQKGQLLLVQATRIVRQRFPGFRVVFAGDGPLRPDIEAAAARLGVADAVTITGWCSNARVMEEITAARAMVLPSFAEGLPVVIMEALAAGRPVVSTYVAGIPELVRPGETGWLVPAGDADALAAALIDVLVTPTARLTEIGRAGRAAVASRHDATVEAARLARLINEPSAIA